MGCRVERREQPVQLCSCSSVEEVAHAHLDNEAPDTSERELILPSPRERVWAALTQADQLAACLADRTRRQVLRLVAVRGPTSATTLERELPVTRQAIVKHLVVLSRAGLVAGRRLPRQSGY